MFRVPVLFVGEFDQSVGFNISDAFELFMERRLTTTRCAVRACGIVDGRVVLGKSVAGGNLRRSLHATVSTLAARTLGGDSMNSGYSAILTDPVLGGVASVTFELRDHEARGTRRKCCLLLVLPDEERLVSRWHLICPCLELLASRWEALSQEIIAQETLASDTSAYRTNVQPDRLRRVSDLLASKILPTESTALIEIMLTLTCSKKVQLLASNLVGSGAQKAAQANDSQAVFRSPIKHLTCDTPLAGFKQHFKAELYKTIDRRFLCVVTGEAVVVHRSGSPPGRSGGFHFETTPMSQTLEHREAVIPLATLLIRVLKAELGNFNNFSIKMGPLLTALLSGNQIIVDVHPDCGVTTRSIVASLAEILPRALRRVHPYASDYIPPNQCRLLAFEPRQEFVMTRETEHFGKLVFVLTELRDPSTIIFQLTPGAAKVTEVAQILRDAGMDDGGDGGGGDVAAKRRLSAGVSPKFVGSEDVIHKGTFTKPPLSLPTLVHRVLTAVKLHCEVARAFAADKERVQVEESLLQCQLMQLVREYVCRGRLYTKMLRRQREEEFHHAMAGRLQKPSFATRVLNIFRKPSSIAAAAPLTQGGAARSRTPSVVMVDPTDAMHTASSAARYEKQASGLSTVSRSARFISPEEALDPSYKSQQRRLSRSDLCDVLPVDHDVLVFLGTVASPFGPRDSE